MIMVVIDEDTSIFLKGFDKDGNLVFRSSRNPANIQREKPTIDGDFAFLNLYHFPKTLLNNLEKIEE